MNFLLESIILLARLVFYHRVADFGSLLLLFHFHCYSNLVQPIHSPAPATNSYLNWLHFLYMWPVGQDLYFGQVSCPKAHLINKRQPHPYTQTLWNSEDHLTLEFSWEHNFLICFCSAFFTVIEVFSLSL